MDRIPSSGELYRHFTDKLYQVVTVAIYEETGEQLVVYQAMFADFGVYAMPLSQFVGEVDHIRYPQAEQQYLFEKVERKEELGNRKADVQRADAAGTRQNAPTRKTDEPAMFWQALREPQRQSFAMREKSGQTAGEPLQQDNAACEKTNRTIPESAPADHMSAASELSSRGLREVHHGVSGRTASGEEMRPRTQSPAESRRGLQHVPADAAGADSYYSERRRRQIEEREQRRGMFRRPQKHESATEELRANPCLLKFLEADTYEEKFQVLIEIQDDITDRLIDDIAVVLDVVIPEGPLNDRFRQLKSIIITRQKYEINRLRN